MIKIYTDGSCLKNPGGPGGYAFVIIDDDIELHHSEGCKSTTNNREEMKAVIEALKCINTNSECKIYTDSKLVINCASGLWKRKANLDLWSEYDNVSKNKKISFIHVKGHSGDKYNEIVDKLAQQEARKLK